MTSPPPISSTGALKVSSRCCSSSNGVERWGRGLAGLVIDVRNLTSMLRCSRRNRNFYWLLCLNTHENTAEEKRTAKNTRKRWWRRDTLDNWPQAQSLATLKVTWTHRHRPNSSRHPVNRNESKSSNTKQTGGLKNRGKNCHSRLNSAMTLL